VIRKIKVLSIGFFAAKSQTIANNCYKLSAGKSCLIKSVTTRTLTLAFRSCIHQCSRW